MTVVSGYPRKNTTVLWLERGLRSFSRRTTEYGGWLPEADTCIRRWGNVTIPYPETSPRSSYPSAPLILFLEIHLAAATILERNFNCFETIAADMAATVPTRSNPASNSHPVQSGGIK